MIETTKVKDLLLQSVSPLEFENAIAELNKLKKFKKFPHSKDIEVATLGGILSDPNVIHKLHSLHLSDFSNIENLITFVYMSELYIRNIPLDINTLGEYVLGAEQVKNLPSTYFESFTTYIYEILNNTISTINIDIYIEILKSKSRLRRLLLMSEDLQLLLNKEKILDDQSIINECRNLVDYSFKDLSSVSQISPINLGLPPTFEEFVQNELKYNQNSMSTGFKPLDELLGGLIPGRLYLLAGRPAMGKTTLGMNIIENMILQEPDISGLIFSLEMNSRDIISRMLCSLSQVSKNNIYQNIFLSSGEVIRVRAAYNQILASEVLIYDNPSLSMVDLHYYCKLFKDKKGAKFKFIMIDYIQLMGFSSANIQQSRYQDITNLSRSLKILAADLRIPVIAISQLNRNVDERVDKRPMPSDLRDSGALEQDADAIIFLYRDCIYNRKANLNNAEIIVSKNRHGPTGTILTKFYGNYYKFTLDNFATKESLNTHSHTIHEFN